MKSNETNTNDILLIATWRATNDELITMYIKGTNKFAKREMKQRGLY